MAADKNGNNGLKVTNQSIHPSIHRPTHSHLDLPSSLLTQILDLPREQYDNDNDNDNDDASLQPFAVNEMAMLGYYRYNNIHDIRRPTSE